MYVLKICYAIELTKFIKVLDKREKRNCFKRSRVSAIMSKSVPPVDAPLWAVSQKDSHHGLDLVRSYIQFLNY